MSYRVLARRSGVSQPTVQRVLTGHGPAASIASVEAIAAALGMRLGFTAEDESQMREKEARRKAEWLARAVQGTSGLEAQAVDDATLRALIDKTFHELLAGSPRRLWDE